MYHLPRGSSLGPILFSLYMLPLRNVLSQVKGYCYYCYVDNTQIYPLFKPDNTSCLSSLMECITAIKKMDDLQLLITYFYRKPFLMADP